jgi:hypothetical protein
LAKNKVIGSTDDTNGTIGKLKQYISEFVNPRDISPQNEIVYVLPVSEYQTSNIMSLYEMTDYVSQRGAQIAKFNNCMVDISGLRDPCLMAKRELMLRRSPLMLDRKVGHGYIKGVEYEFHEYWNPNEMEFRVSYPEAM